MKAAYVDDNLVLRKNPRAQDYSILKSEVERDTGDVIFVAYQTCQGDTFHV